MKQQMVEHSSTWKYLMSAQAEGFTKGQCDTALGVTNDLRLENEQEVIFIVGNNKPLNLEVLNHPSRQPEQELTLFRRRFAWWKFANLWTKKQEQNQLWRE